MIAKTIIVVGKAVIWCGVVVPTQPTYGGGGMAVGTVHGGFREEKQVAATNAASKCLGL